MNQLNLSFGSGGMSSALESNTLIEYIQYLQRSHDGPIAIKKGVTVPGFQNDTVYILNRDTFIDQNGVLLDPSETECVAKPRSGT